MMWWWLVACGVGEVGPATEGSPSALEVAELEAVAAQAQAIEAQAAELEALVEAARQRVEAGGDRQPEIDQMQALMTEIEVKNKALQSNVAAFEARVKSHGTFPEAPEED